MDLGFPKWICLWEVHTSWGFLVEILNKKINKYLLVNLMLRLIFLWMGNRVERKEPQVISGLQVETQWLINYAYVSA